MNNLSADHPPRQPLWPDKVPESLALEPVGDHQPALTIYAPSSPNGTAVVICPGGGYGNLAMSHEGHDIGNWLSGLGITGIVLEYRMSRGGYHHPIPLMDAQRALRTVRYRAKELGLRPDRIGILGFSAGGHLASTAGTHFDAGRVDAQDPIDRVSCRPDFMILCYPVIAFGETYTHKGSQKNLLGSKLTDELVQLLSNEKQVTSQTPPTFLFHTDEDSAVPAENSVMFYLALRKAKIPAELHIYNKGHHGLGLAKGVAGTEDWSKACEQWLKAMGWLQGG
jgi:acetyl esterase/lipase